MARSRAFDEEQVLDRVVEVFWERGYDATSVADLEEELGIGRQSLYNAFGDKRRLFLRALERYATWNSDLVSRTLLGPESGLRAIRSYFDAVVESLTPIGRRRACLVANSILEIGDGDADVESLCRRSQRSVVAALQRALQDAIAAAELADDFDIDAGASLLMAQVYGMSVLSKSGASARELRAAAAALIDRL